MVNGHYDGEDSTMYNCYLVAQDGRQLFDCPEGIEDSHHHGSYGKNSGWSLKLCGCLGFKLVNFYPSVSNTLKNSQNCFPNRFKI